MIQVITSVLGWGTIAATFVWLFYPEALGKLFVIGSAAPTADGTVGVAAPIPTIWTYENALNIPWYFTAFFALFGDPVSAFGG